MIWRKVFLIVGLPPIKTIELLVEEEQQLRIIFLDSKSLHIFFSMHAEFTIYKIFIFMHAINFLKPRKNENGLRLETNENLQSEYMVSLSIGIIHNVLSLSVKK